MIQHICCELYTQIHFLSSRQILLNETMGSSGLKSGKIYSNFKKKSSRIPSNLTNSERSNLLLTACYEDTFQNVCFARISLAPQPDKFRYTGLKTKFIGTYVCRKFQITEIHHVDITPCRYIRILDTQVLTG